MNFVQAVQGLTGRIYYTVTSSVIIEFVHLVDTLIRNELNCIQYMVCPFIYSDDWEKLPNKTE